MRQTSQLKKQIEKISKINFTLIGISCGFMFSYLILLGLTATNVVANRSLSRIVEDKKTELATVELDYMSSQNIMALENASNVDFAGAKNISYVTPGEINTSDTTLFAMAKK